MWKAQGLVTLVGQHAAQSRFLVQWHRAIGHNNFNDVARLTKQVDGMHIRMDGAAGHCDTCAEEKAKRAPVNKVSGTRAKKKLDIVHTDVLGQYIRSHTRVSDMQSGSLTATLFMLSFTHCGHETRSLRSWNSSSGT